MGAIKAKGTVFDESETLRVYPPAKQKVIGGWQLIAAIC